MVAISMSVFFLLVGLAHVWAELHEPVLTPCGEGLPALPVPASEEAEPEYEYDAVLDALEVAHLLHVLTTPITARALVLRYYLTSNGRWGVVERLGNGHKRARFLSNAEILRVLNS
jgi:hypothetical protein